jgi:hypothetical protein
MVNSFLFIKKPVKSFIICPEKEERNKEGKKGGSKGGKEGEKEERRTSE